MKKVILLTLAVAVLAACQSPQQKAEKRAQTILKQLTLEEKASLMVYNSPAVERLGIRSYNWWNEALHGVARNGAATVFPRSPHKAQNGGRKRLVSGTYVLDT